MSLQPKGEDLRKAIRWISDSLKYEPGKKARALVMEASFKFDLSPKDEAYLMDFYKQRGN